MDLCVLGRHAVPQHGIDQQLAPRQDDEDGDEQQAGHPRVHAEPSAHPSQTPAITRPCRGRTRPCPRNESWMLPICRSRLLLLVTTGSRRPPRATGSSRAARDDRLVW